jgi:soluble lytic murein transglycosylase-like protein
MERLEALQVPELAAVDLRTADEPVLSKALADVSRRVTGRTMPWAIASIGVSLALIFGLGFSAYLLAPSLIGIHRAMEANASEAKTWAEETTALKKQTHELKLEVEALRQYIGSASSEDVIFLKIMFLKPSIDRTLARKIARHVHKYSELYGKDPNLVLAIIEIESDFNPKATSSVGATGLMQVMPQWKKVLAIKEDLDDPETSIRYGLQILGFYTEMYKDLEMALTAYNRGPGPVDSALMRGRDHKNGYSATVLAAYSKLKQLSVTSAAR